MPSVFSTEVIYTTLQQRQKLERLKEMLHYTAAGIWWAKTWLTVQ